MLKLGTVGGGGHLTAVLRALAKITGKEGLTVPNEEIQ